MPPKGKGACPLVPYRTVEVGVWDEDDGLYAIMHIAARNPADRAGVPPILNHRLDTAEDQHKYRFGALCWIDRDALAGSQPEE